MSKKLVPIFALVFGRVLGVVLGITLGLATAVPTLAEERSVSMNESTDRKTELATLGAGCFWCVEAVFERIEGVVSVVPGYAGGDTDNPTYKEVCSGDSGHAEVAQIEFDPQIVSYAKVLEVFWKSHDPTTLNQQGADRGTQYRSVIFYHDDAQREIAEKSKKAVDASGAFKNSVVTFIEPLPKFYRAEDYHQNYFDQNRNAPYCRFVIQPKLDKLGLD
jgi:peptide-methionine (S)-S-oxide reductase